MTDEEMDNLVRECLLDTTPTEEELMEALEAEWEKAGTPAFVPSRRHEREMRRMLRNPNAWARHHERKMRRRERKYARAARARARAMCGRPMWKSVLQKAALFLLVLFLGTGALLTVSPAARAVITNWFVDWHEGHILRCRYEGPALAQPVPPHTVAALPAGFAETRRDTLLTAAFITYEDADGGAIYLEYAQIVPGAQVHRQQQYPKNDLLEAVMVRIGESDGQFIPSQEPHGLNTLLWYDREAGIQFALAGTCGQSELLAMAESVEKTEQAA